MGLRNLFRRWSKDEDADAIERAEEQSRMTAYERDLDQSEGLEGHKTDTMVDNRLAGLELLSGGDFDIDRDRI